MVAASPDDRAMSASPRITDTAAPIVDVPDAAPAPRIVTFATVAAALGIILLVVPEIWVAAAALVWALGSLLHLDLIVEAAIALLVAVPALWATWQVARMAFDAETDPANAVA